MLQKSGLEYEFNGDQRYAINSTMNISIKGVDSEALMLSSKSYCSISNGSACNSKSYRPSYVLSAMGIPTKQIEQSIRISWGAGIGIKEAEEAFGKLLVTAQGLVW